MVRRMYDSVDAGAIPAAADMVGGYVDGRYAWSLADWSRFADAIKVRISAIGSNINAHVFDVEVGCIWPPARVVPLVVAARKIGIDPTVYVNERNDWGPTKAAFDAAGVAHPHWWVANYDGREDYLSPGAVARQYANPPMVGFHADASAVADFWPGVDDNEGDTMATGDDFTDHEEDRVLAAAGKQLDNYRVTDGGPGDVRPDDYPLDRPDDQLGHIMTLRSWQRRHIDLNKSMNEGIARIETVVNQILQALTQLQVSGQTQEGFDALFRTSPLSKGLLREGAVFVDNDPPPTGQL